MYLYLTMYHLVIPLSSDLLRRQLWPMFLCFQIFLPVMLSQLWLPKLCEKDNSFEIWELQKCVHFIVFNMCVREKSSSAKERKKFWSTDMRDIKIKAQHITRSNIAVLLLGYNFYITHTLFAWWITSEIPAWKQVSCNYHFIVIYLCGCGYRHGYGHVYEHIYTGCSKKCIHTLNDYKYNVY